jgi:two-component system chemotaxis response regulator CheY
MNKRPAGLERACVVTEALAQLEKLPVPILSHQQTFVLWWPGLAHLFARLANSGPPMPIDRETLAERFTAAKVVVVDDEFYMRKVVRTLLMSLGVRNVHEAADGPAGLELIRTVAPTVVILDWEMPGLDGAGFVRMVRSPETFPYPDVPIIMLTGHGERSRVIEAIEIGVNEFLLKPVSTKALQDRMTAVLTKPRRLVKSGGYYGPEPRKLATVVHADNDQAIADLIYLD